MLHSGDNCLTGIRQPTSGVTPSGHGEGFVAYPAALIAFYQVTAMKVIMRIGWQLPNPPNWLKPTYGDATRYPFAVLTP